MHTATSGPGFDVLLQGNPFCDLTFTFDDREELPPLGQEVFASNFAINPGGVFNIAAALSRLSLRVGLRTRLGNDLFSRFIAERMAECGLSLQLTERIDWALPIVTVGISFRHDRLYVSYAPPPEAVPRAPVLTLRDLDCLHPRVLFSYGELGPGLYREARRRGILTYVDASWDPEHLRSSVLREALACVDVFAPNRLEALEITQADTVEDALAILSGWCRCVVIKLGADGCVAARDGCTYRVPPLPVEAIDTTGAGDNFNAGLIYGLLRGYSLERSLSCANIAGALSTLVLGGCGSNVSVDEMESTLEERCG